MHEMRSTVNEVMNDEGLPPGYSQIAAYEREISALRQELLTEIGHLEEKKEEAVQAASSCSAEHFQSLQEQFFSELLWNPIKREMDNLY